MNTSRHMDAIETICTMGCYRDNMCYGDMLKKYGMMACKRVATPMDQNVKLMANVGDVLEDPTMYKKIIGSLIYVTLTQPDMSHDVGVLSQFMQVPRKPHLDATHRVLCYAKRTLNYWLFY